MKGILGFLLLVIQLLNFLYYIRIFYKRLIRLPYEITLLSIFITQLISSCFKIGNSVL